MARRSIGGSRCSSWISNIDHHENDRDERYQQYVRSTQKIYSCSSLPVGSGPYNSLCLKRIRGVVRLVQIIQRCGRYFERTRTRQELSNSYAGLWQFQAFGRGARIMFPISRDDFKNLLWTQMYDDGYKNIVNADVSPRPLSLPRLNPMACVLQ